MSAETDDTADEAADWKRINITTEAFEVFGQNAVPGYPKGRQLSALLTHWYGRDIERENLTPKEVAALKRLKESGVKPDLLADAFGVSRPTVEKIESRYDDLFGGGDGE